MPRTPPPVEGRMHMDAQTEEFLEELTDRPVEVGYPDRTIGHGCKVGEGACAEKTLM